MSEAESAVQQAETAAATVLGAATESDDDETIVQRPTRPSSASGVSESDLRPLESTARKARAAGSTSPQVGVEGRKGRGGEVGLYL